MRGVIDQILDRTVKQRLPGSYGIYSIARRIVRAYENGDVNIASNGEAWLQQMIARRSPQTALDIGANRGDWADAMLKDAPECVVHCYEPVPTTFAKLERRLSGHNRAHVNQVALSNQEGEVSMNSVNTQSDLASFHADYSDTLAVRSIRVSTQRGDAELDRLGVEHVDIVKIDTEGHDLAVLSGFSQALRHGKIDFIQFEYNSATLAARKTLKDFFDLLSPDYILCRLLPKCLEACGYHPVLDTFSQSNWVAVGRHVLDGDLVRSMLMTKMRGLPRAALDRIAGDDGDVSRIPISN